MNLTATRTTAWWIVVLWFSQMLISLQVSVADQMLSGPVGWASVEGGTNGGQGGKTITVSDRESLIRQVQSSEPLTVRVMGTIQLTGMVKVASHKTIVGIGTKPTLSGGGLNLSGVEQVIIRRLRFIESPDDAINLQEGTHHVWIDHCELTSAKDGLIDVKRGSDLLTVSWCHFHDHGKTCLVGHSDKSKVVADDKGKLRVTYHHNFFDGTKTRHPRVRVGETVHVFNNYFRHNEYGVASTMDAGVLVEGNYFDHVKHPTHTQYGSSKPGRLVHRDNIFIDSGDPVSRGDVPEPKIQYRYQLDPTDEIPQIVKAGAGVSEETP